MEAGTMAERRYALRGEVDLAAVEQIQPDLMGVIAHDRHHLLVDCSALTFIDSSGIAMLLEADRELEADGRHLLIVNVPEVSRRVFEVLGLTKLLRDDRQIA
jgi:anti-anti-sigma factor